MATRPAICVTGIDAPATANAANVLVPAARAKVSLRLAPQESASKALVALTRHLEAHTPWGAEISVTPVSMTDGFRASITRPTADAINSALSDVWGHQAVQLGVGGSIPFVTAFAQAFPDSQMLMIGVEDPDSRAHAADESVHLGEFTRACVAETLLLSRLASLRR